MTPIERIELSRARLRGAMMPPPTPPDGASKSPFGSLWRRFETLPVVSLVIDAAHGWWSQHPLHAVAEVAGDAASAISKPLAQRKPLTLVVLAALIGAALASRRPWRWLLKPALFAGVMPQVISRVITNLPLESWTKVLGDPLGGRPATADDSRPLMASLANAAHDVPRAAA